MEGRAWSWEFELQLGMEFERLVCHHGRVMNARKDLGDGSTDDEEIPEGCGRMY